MGTVSPHLLLLGTTLGIGGTERAMLTLAKALTHTGVDVRTIMPTGELQADLLEWFAREGVQAECSPALRRPGSERFTHRDVLRLTRFIRSAPCDIVNIHYGGNNISLKDVLAVRLSGRKRCIVTVHHAVPVHSSRYARSNRIAGLLADHTIVTTPLMRSILVASGVPIRKISVIALGLEQPPICFDKRQMRQRIGIPDDAFLVCSLSRLVAYKGIHDVIDAVAHLAADDDKLWLVIAGDGPDRQALAARVAKHHLSNVRFLGHVQDTAEVYAASDLFVLPSREEGFGQVYIEAAFHAVPSIGADVGGVRYAIQHGITGLMVPPGDQAALLDALRHLRYDHTRRQRMGREAQQRATTVFTIDQMVHGYRRVLLDT
jgi:glycosyltransferase involved in cell wall biosynthesis